MVKETPILMSPRSMAGILNGTKTQTRRIVKPQWKPDVDPKEHSQTPDYWIPYFGGKLANDQPGSKKNDCGIKCPFGTSGDKLWIKETFAGADDPAYKHRIITYRADGKTALRWHPSLFMPREFSRFNPTILSIRMECLQDITEADAIAEGCKPESVCTARDQYRTWWTQLNSKPKPIYKKKQIIAYECYPWENIQVTRLHKDLPCYVHGNPWVWVIEFEKVV